MPAGKEHDDNCKCLALDIIDADPFYRVDADLPKEYIKECPLISTLSNQIFGEYLPDLYAINKKTNETIIAEIETEESLSTQHAIKQIEYLVLYSCKNQKCSFYLGVPLYSMEQGAQMLRNIILRKNLKCYSIVIVGFAFNKILKRQCLKL
jgi:hypothetical protein